MVNTGQQSSINDLLNAHHNIFFHIFFSRIFFSTTSCSFFIIPMIRDIFLDTSFICKFQVMWDLIHAALENIKNWISSILALLMRNCKTSMFIFGLRNIIYLDLFVFNFCPFAISQLWILCSSWLTIVCIFTWFISSRQQYKVVSSAYTRKLKSLLIEMGRNRYRVLEVSGIGSISKYQYRQKIRYWYRVLFDNISILFRYFTSSFIIRNPLQWNPNRTQYFGFNVTGLNNIIRLF